MKIIRTNGWQAVTSLQHASPRACGGIAADAEVWTLTAKEAGALALSRREVECLEWLARGFQDERIAGRLSLSRSTVRLHLTNARRKLKSTTRVQALVRAMQLGLIAP